jgi:Family of unknown function (DUF5670)
MQRAGIFLLVGSVVIPAVLGFLWLLGLVAGFTLGGFIHLLLVLAVVLFPSFAIAGITFVIIGSRKA